MKHLSAGIKVGIVDSGQVVFRRVRPSPAERSERLEQLRALHCGLTIGVARLDRPALPGVDTPDDLQRAEAHWHAFEG